ncbi:oxidoreductase [bacterium]|nr:MAG: oxidoreductase [bacterium]
MAKKKITLALKRGASCVGCDIAVVNFSEKLFELLEIADVVFSPTLIDVKYKDLEAMPDKSITIGLYHGAVRNSENAHLAEVMRKKCQVLIAYGACAHMGGIPGLANVSNREKIFETVYKKTFSTENPEGVYPQTEWKDEKGRTLTLPEFFDEVYALDDIVDVDYYVPACPPTHKMNMQILELIKAWVEGKAELPPKGTVIAEEKTLCDECPRNPGKEKNIKVDKIRYISEVNPDPDKCFLEQGILCLGPATRAGCGAPCIEANMPCRGCMGPTSRVMDQGGSMLSAIASILGIREDEIEISEEEIEKLVSQIKDPLGCFYRFSLPRSLLRRVVEDRR